MVFVVESDSPVFVQSQGVSGFLDRKDMLDLRKKEILHKKWNDRVYHPIRNQVVNAVNSGEYSELDLRKRELYKEYLEHVNRKVI